MAAAAHADAVEVGWTARARMLFRDYALTHQRFTTEDVVTYATQVGLSSPPDPRAWGAVAVHAKRAGSIYPDGYVESANARAHRRPTRQWRSLLAR